MARASNTTDDGYVLMINLKPWDLNVKSPDDEIEELNIMIYAF